MEGRYRVRKEVRLRVVHLIDSTYAPENSVDHGEHTQVENIAQTVCNAGGNINTNTRKLS